MQMANTQHDIYQGLMVLALILALLVIGSKAVGQFQKFNKGTSERIKTVRMWRV